MSTVYFPSPVRRVSQARLLGRKVGKVLTWKRLAISGWLLAGWMTFRVIDLSQKVWVRDVYMTQYYKMPYNAFHEFSPGWEQNPVSSEIRRVLIRSLPK